MAGRFSIFLAAVALAGLPGVCASRDLPRADAEPGQFRTNTSLVLIDAIVLDRKGRAVPGLAQRDFRILEDKLPQVVRYFSQESAPASIAVVFDASGSMNGQLKESRRAVGSLVDSTERGDEYCLISVAERPRILLGWTKNGIELQNRTSFLPAHGNTPLLDSMLLALTQLKHAHNTRKVMIVISDGGENASRIRERDLTRAMEESDVQLYAIGLDIAGARQRQAYEGPAPYLLERLAEANGGRYFPCERWDVSKALADTREELNWRYVLGYYPPSDGGGQFRHVRVLLQAERKHLRVYARPGYRARN